MQNIDTTYIPVTPKRGDLFYITENPNQPPIGKEIWSNRVGLIVSSDALNKNAGFVKVVYVSTSPQKRKKLSPTHIPVQSGTKIATAMCEQIHTVDNSRLQNKIGHVPEEQMQEINEGLLFGLGINSGTNPQGIFHKWENYLRTYPNLKTAIQTTDTQNPTILKSLMQELNAYKDLCMVLQDKLKTIQALTHIG